MFHISGWILMSWKDSKTKYIPDGMERTLLGLTSKVLGHYCALAF